VFIISYMTKLFIHNSACFIALSEIKHLTPNTTMQYVHKIFNKFFIIFE